MKSPFKVKPYVYVAGTLALLYVANVLFVQWGMSPFLYCLGRQVVAPLYEAVRVLLVLGAIGYVVFIAVRHRYDKVGEAVLMLLLAFGLPQFADTVFRLGGSCG